MHCFFGAPEGGGGGGRERGRGRSGGRAGPVLKSVVNHVIASVISVIRGDAEEGLAGCALGAVAHCKTLQSREEVGPIALLEILM